MANGEEKSNDFYAVLGLKKDCTAPELKNAYKKLALVSIVNFSCPLFESLLFTVQSNGSSLNEKKTCTGLTLVEHNFSNEHRGFLPDRSTFFFSIFIFEHKPSFLWAFLDKETEKGLEATIFTGIWDNSQELCEFCTTFL